jgi:hypothetical protein
VSVAIEDQRDSMFIERLPEVPENAPARHFIGSEKRFVPISQRTGFLVSSQVVLKPQFLGLTNLTAGRSGMGLAIAV